MKLILENIMLNTTLTAEGALIGRAPTNTDMLIIAEEIKNSLMKKGIIVDMKVLLPPIKQK